MGRAGGRSIGVGVAVTALSAITAIGAVAQSSSARPAGRYAVTIKTVSLTGSLKQGGAPDGARTYSFRRCTQGCAIMGSLQLSNGAFVPVRLQRVDAGVYRGVIRAAGPCPKGGKFTSARTVTVRSVSPSSGVAKRIRGTVVLRISSNSCAGTQRATFTGRRVAAGFTG